jgi:hypothetical protein
MVCYVGRAADNPISARERVDPSGDAEEHRIVRYETGSI